MQLVFIYLSPPLPEKKKKSENQKETRGIKCVNKSQELPQ